MGSYESSYPTTGVDPAHKEFFTNFYQISDSPDAHEKYAQQFTKDATLIMASKTAKGFTEIVNMRHAMWEKVSNRAHNPIKVFPFGQGPGSNEVMLYGTVQYGFKAGGSASKDWAARAVLTTEEGAVKMSFYQVYLDTAS